MRGYLTEYTHLFIQADKHRTARQLHKQSTLYTHTHTQPHKHLSLNDIEDRGMESIHIWRGNRACGDSRVVGASRGSRWCAAERNRFESRFLGVTGGGAQHQAFKNIFLRFKKCPLTFSPLLATHHSHTPAFKRLGTRNGVKYDSFLRLSTFRICQHTLNSHLDNAKQSHLSYITILSVSICHATCRTSQFFCR